MDNSTVATTLTSGAETLAASLMQPVVPFESKLAHYGYSPLMPTGIDIMQINVGKMCNQTCKHCHVDAGPHRKEIMTRATMEQCLDAVNNSGIKTVDLTGGAPEMNPDFRWFVTQLSNSKVNIMVRSNLTILLANPKYYDLPDFFKEHKVEIISSLPHYAARRTDAQRGDGVFDKSIKAIQMLNAVGYGTQPGLWLNLVYNPTGAILPPPQASLEKDFKQRLADNYGLTFNNLYAITNMPISRYLDYLIASDQLERYMEDLVTNFNPLAVESVMCRNMISVGWDGNLYDCDFNQMLDLETNEIQHISGFDKAILANREIKTGLHCYGCTAGAGSSCGGEIL